MHGTVIPFETTRPSYEAFDVCAGTIDEKNQITEREKVGVAFLKGKSKLFSVRLWMFDKIKYFVAPIVEDPTRYDLLSLEEYTTRDDGELKTEWHKIGTGQYFGNYIRLRFHLFDQDLFLCLFPKGHEARQEVA